MNPDGRQPLTTHSYRGAAARLAGTAAMSATSTAGRCT